MVGGPISYIFKPRKELTDAVGRFVGMFVHDAPDLKNKINISRSYEFFAERGMRDYAKDREAVKCDFREYLLDRAKWWEKWRH